MAQKHCCTNKLYSVQLARAKEHQRTHCCLLVRPSEAASSANLSEICLTLNDEVTSYLHLAKPFWTLTLRMSDPHHQPEARSCQISRDSVPYMVHVEIVW